jgi:hypothetical protein
MREFGHLPLNSEYKKYEQLRAICGSHQKAFTLVTDIYDKSDFDHHFHSQLKFQPIIFERQKWDQENLKGCIREKFNKAKTGDFKMKKWFRTGRCGVIFFRLQTMKELIESVLSIIDEEVESVENQFQSAVREGIPDGGLDGIRDDLFVSQQLIPRHIINALFLSLFSLFEDEMVTLCERIAKKSVADNSFKESKGMGLEKCKSYLNENFDIDYPSWNEITKIKNLRNMIIHNNGRFMCRNKKTANNVCAHIKESEFLAGNNEFDLIIIDRQYLSYVEGVFMPSTEELISKIEKQNLLDVRHQPV